MAECALNDSCWASLTRSGSDINTWIEGWVNRTVKVSKDAYLQSSVAAYVHTSDGNFALLLARLATIKESGTETKGYFKRYLSEARRNFKMEVEQLGFRKYSKRELAGYSLLGIGIGALSGGAIAAGFQVFHTDKLDKLCPEWPDCDTLDTDVIRHYRGWE